MDPVYEMLPLGAGGVYGGLGRCSLCPRFRKINKTTDFTEEKLKISYHCTI
jgi:hypothetical protein